MGTLSSGNRGEDRAQEYLFARGYEILHRNWRNGRYELDLVAVRDGVLHIIEVKTRRKDSLTSPEEALTRKKFKALCRAAEYYIALYHIDLEVQFDLLAIEYDESGACEIRHIPDAMSPVW